VEIHIPVGDNYKVWSACSVSEIIRPRLSGSGASTLSQIWGNSLRIQTRKGELAMHSVTQACPEKLCTTGSILDELAARQGIDLKSAVDGGIRLQMLILKPALGTLSIRSENPRIVSVYHHPPATAIGHAGAVWRTEDFVLREMDLMLSDDGSWTPIRYSTDGFATKNPAELRLYFEAWGEMLSSEDWASGDLIALEREPLEIVAAVDAPEDEPHRPHQRLFRMIAGSIV
jgi:hypothetical protein